MSRVLVIGALPESLVNFRGELLKRLVGDGHDVTAMAACDEPSVRARLVEMGVAFQPFPVQRNGMNPLNDLRTYLALRRTMLAMRPEVVLAYTIKPVIYGGLAFRALKGGRFVALIEGLGFAFQGGSLPRRLIRQVVSTLYRAALRRATRVVFLNPDNRRAFLERRLVEVARTSRIDGIGVDLDWYHATPLPETGTVFLTIARLLGEKGLREFARAAGLVRQRYPDAEFRLVGQPDPSPDGIPMAEVAGWEAEYGVRYLGATDDVRPHLAGCHVYVLASYHEGMPRTILEAMAMGRPILTTDAPGCRETVTTGENGFLVPKADVNALAERMLWFVEHRDRWPDMAAHSRRLAEERFDVHKINGELLDFMGLSSCL